MGLMFTVSFNGTITAAGGDTDLFEFLSPVRPILLRQINLGQISEVAGAAEEGLRLSVIRITGSIVGGNPGNPGSAEHVSRANQSLGATQAVNNDTVATGTLEILDEIPWINRQSPMILKYPDKRFCPRIAGAGEALVVRLQTTLADDMTFVGSVILEEEPV